MTSEIASQTGDPCGDVPTAFDHAHSMDATEVMDAFQTSRHGLSKAEAELRLTRFGPNTLPQQKPPGILWVFFRQFLNPLIYILLVAAVISLSIGEGADAFFIMAVLLINAIIGTIQEYAAERSASALQRLVTTVTRVERSSEAYEIDAGGLVPGDVVLLESGDKVPADLRLISAHGLSIDESLLTGESLAVRKEADILLDTEAPVADRINCAFAGTMVTHGRSIGVVVGTGANTEIGRLAEAVAGKSTKPPLLLRMERFTFRIAVLVGIAATITATVAFSRGMPINEVFLLAVALAVSAIPEGLPVALTVALAVGMRRMSRRNVICRRLVTVEALGSCTFIASDKTGTLTVNELTASKLILPGLAPFDVTTQDSGAEGAILTDRGLPPPKEQVLLERLGRAVALANEGFFGRRDESWVHHGDAVDVALLILAHKIGITRPEALNTWPELAVIPFEPQIRFSASFNEVDGETFAFVKGAIENVLPMCDTMATLAGDVAIVPEMFEVGMHDLATQGYRVMAIAAGATTVAEGEVHMAQHLKNLTCLGLVGMMDPLRQEAKGAVAACRSAGIEVCMITGDHPTTAGTIARELNLIDTQDAVVTGTQFKQAMSAGHEVGAELVQEFRVFARVEPEQKLDIVHCLQNSGHFVAVTGDGANDAPALRAAHVGVAMGKKGTDVARETAAMIITDDDFSSIVAGVEEGRIAYGNVRKVIFLLISTGAAEIVLFTLALLTSMPLPLFAVQLLWLNLVTNGIQDVTLALEPGEGNELKRPPRDPNEPIFDRLMVERVVLSALFMGTVAFFHFQSMIESGHSMEAARNTTLLLMVLFENVHVFNSRSETLSAFRHNLMRNPVLLFGTAVAQLVHIGAMYTPGLREVLQVEPVSMEQWLNLLGIALLLLLVMEAHKAVRSWTNTPSA